jgi:hypothetical protein
MGSGDSVCASRNPTYQARICIRFDSNLRNRYTFEMAQGKAPVVRKGVVLAETTMRYLEDMVGTYGTDVVDVMRTLIEQGVRDAISEGFINKRPNSN